MRFSKRSGAFRLVLYAVVLASCGTTHKQIYEPPKATPPFMLIWPMQNPVVTEFFGWRKRRMHEGIDFKARVGDPVFSAGDGRVVYAGRGLRGYGKMVLIQHEGAWSTLYAHLSAVLLKQGQIITKGQLIGKAGSTGRSTGPHLHFEVRYGADPVDPMVYLPTKIVPK
ncbi:MAG TPA: M23 family metallopeptidase [Bdellovibrionota bacterium]|jgi:murein DD-endopeptidase MepM/ murein hydrolase activator NlpD|nr:M23 family metallopeptidase [Bdellovibrionota bacterium]